MSVDGIFSVPIFGGPKETQKNQAATGFTQVFASMLAQQMREALAGEDKGPLGTGGGTTGDIYGSFLDQAMGRALANSPALKPLNRAIERELSGTKPAVAKSVAPVSAALTQSGQTPLYRQIRAVACYSHLSQLRWHWSCLHLLLSGARAVSNSIRNIDGILPNVEVEAPSSAGSSSVTKPRYRSMASTGRRQMIARSYRRWSI